MKRVVWALGGAALALVLVGVVVASSWPDGLTTVAHQLGFDSRESAVLGASPFAGYETRFFRSRWAAQASAGLVGIVILYGFGVLLGRALRKGPKKGPKKGK